MDGKTINWGVLGCGKIAHKFAHDILQCEGAALVACASRDRDRSDNFARQFQIPHIYDNYDNMLMDHRVDAVYIATPHSQHFQNALSCIDAHKHVLCEKPMTINDVQMDILINAAKEKKIFLMEAVWTAFLPMMTELRKMISNGVIGKIRFIKADFGFFCPFDQTHRMFNLALGGGALLDIGIYPIFMATSLLGEPLQINSTMLKSPTGSDTSTAVNLLYSNGAIASLFSTIETNTSNTCEIFGTLGKILIPSRFHEQENIIITLNSGVQETLHLPRKGLGYSHEILHFNECLRNGFIESPVMSYQMSRTLMNIMDEVRRQNGLVYPDEMR